ncbi:Protein of unknown function [Pyronema omphalodes CBS 100304]|uniref:Uncharacterized protein n=1 Tax=Pyronema omphalodes (strain CBS 100304) TaxID=1076935 RepID=U4LUI4_PYROM|nr:Protein of unknown function [Pyronema omphalodes CBS 100304]
MIISTELEDVTLHFPLFPDYPRNFQTEEPYMLLKSSRAFGWEIRSLFRFVAGPLRVALENPKYEDPTWCADIKRFYAAAFFIAGVDDYDLIADGVNLGHTDSTEAVDVISEFFFGKKEKIGFFELEECLSFVQSNWCRYLREVQTAKVQDKAKTVRLQERRDLERMLGYVKENHALKGIVVLDEENWDELCDMARDNLESWNSGQPLVAHPQYRFSLDHLPLNRETSPGDLNRMISVGSMGTIL